MGLGPNLYGQLGDGTNTDRNTPTQIGTATNWKTIAAGGWQTLGLRDAMARSGPGATTSTGSSATAPTSTATPPPRSAPPPTGRASIAGSWHTVALRTDGTLWSWGYNGYGQLGDGTNIDRHTPTQIGTATNWKTTAAGGAHTVATRGDGTLWSWGWNSTGSSATAPPPTGSLPTQIGTATNWKTTAAGGAHTVGVTRRRHPLGLGLGTSRRSSATAPPPTATPPPRSAPPPTGRSLPPAFTTPPRSVATARSGPGG